MDVRGLGEAIRAARLAKGWTQVELGRRIFRSQTRVAEMESGYKPPTREDLVHLGNALDMYSFDCALIAFVTGARLGMVAPVNGGAPGAMMALEWEMRDLLAAIERVRMSLCRVAETPCAKTLAELRCDIRDCVVLANAMEIECDQIVPMSARELARQYAETRRHYAAKQNRPVARAAS